MEAPGRRPLSASSVRTQDGCRFCREVAGSPQAQGLALALADAFPVAHGHTLVITRRHVPSLFDARPDEQDAVWRLVATVRRDLVERYGVEAFTVGVNDGSIAGQTVPHAHVHVIPRRQGDAADPTGGVRRLIEQTP